MSSSKRWLSGALVVVVATLSACGGGSGGGVTSGAGVGAVNALPFGLVSTSPAPGATGVALDATISVTAATTLNPATLTAATFTLSAVGGAAVAGAIRVVGGNTATFEPTLTLADSTQYIATITTGALDTTGAGLTSDFSWTFTTVTVPGAPTIGTATAGDSQATVTFAPPASNGGMPIVSYVVTSNPGGITGTGAASPIVVPGLINGTPYTFTVTATNSVGASPPSGPSNSVTPQTGAAVPGAPTGVTVLGPPTGDSQATVSFTPPASPGSSAILSYTVTALIGGVPTAISSSGGTSPVVVPGLTNGTAYTFTVTAFNSAGPGPLSAPSTAATPAGMPTAPSAVIATAGNTQASVAFAAPASNGGAAIASYTVTSNPGGITASGAISPIVVPGLINGTPYTFTVTATNSVPLTGPPSAPSNNATPSPTVTVPGAPTAVTATAGNADATVAFTPPASNGGSAIVSYTVTSSPGGLPASGAASPIVVPGLTNGVAYTFTVRATNSVGTGGASGPSNAVTPATVPGAPVGPSATAGNTQATVVFSAPASNGGSAITGYVVTSNPAGGVDTNAGAPGLSHVVTGLTNGIAYTFTVTANNSVGVGSPSAATSVVTPTAGTVPGAPTAVAATAGNAQATVTFSAPASNGGSAITGYTVTSSPPGGVDTNAGSTGLSHVITGLTNGTAYTFTATATNIVGTSPASVASNSVVPATLPGAPTAASAIAGNGQATVSFTPPASNGGAPILIYTVTSSPGGITASGGASPILVTGLTNGTLYTFTVTASNSVGTGAPSAATSGVTPNPATTVPPAPTAANATAGNAQATVTFTAPACSLPTCPAISGYTVTSSPPGGVDTNAGSTGLSHVVTGLTNGTAYTFTVTATNIVGTGPASGASNTVTPATLPGAPTLTSATAGAAQATITFAPPASNGGSAITSYTVTSNPDGLSASGATSPIVVPGLTNGTPYTFTVTATNGVGVGPASSATNSVTPSPVATVPGPPTAASATAGNGQATVSFVAPASDGGSPITGYTVISGPGGFAASGATSPIVVPGLVNGTTYTFVVRATNSLGSGPPSGASNAVTPATAPGAPTAVTAIAGNQIATVSFTPPASDGGSGIINYTVTSTPDGISVVGAASPIVVTGLTNLTPYTFTVTATNSIATGPSSVASVAVTPTSATVPGAPTAASATAGNAQATVTFNAPASDGGSAITGYTVTSNPGGGVDTNAGTAGLSHVITGLTNGTAYTFTVTATNIVGTGAASAASGAVTPATAPGVPTAVNATAGNGQATVSFTAPASNGGSAITSYTVTSSPSNIVGSGATSPIIVAGLANGTPYTFTVTATNALGTGLPSAASNTVTPSALPPTCSPTVPVVAGAISLRAQAARASGISPLSVFFDATTTTSSATTRPFHDIEYRWDFADPIGSLTWANGSKTGVSRRDLAKGPVAAHVFEPGTAEYSSGFVTRNVTLTAFDGTSTATCSIPITIRDPDHAVATPEFAGNRTTCFSNNTDFTGCPAGANQVITNNFATVTNSATGANTIRRLLMRRSGGAAGTQIFFMTGASGRLVAPGPGILGAFGPPGPIPIVRATVNSTMLQMSSQTTPTFADWRVMDIELDGQSIANILGVDGGGGGNQLTFLRMSIHHTSTGMQFIDAALNTHNSSGFPGHTLWDQQTIQDTVILSSSSYGLIHGARRFALLGSLLGDLTTTANHIHRPGFIAKGVLSNNTYRNQAINGSVVKMHSQGFSNPPGVTAPGLFTEQVVVSDNLYAGGSNSAGTMMIIGPTSPFLDERLREIIVERNWFRSGSGTSNALTVHADEITVRNNYFDTTGGTSGTGVSVGRAGTEPTHSNIRLLNNSFRSASVIFYIGVTVNAGTSLVTFQNNLGSAPFGTGGSALLSNGSGMPMVIQNNLFTNTPGFVTATVAGVQFGANTDYNLTGGSAARNAGLTFPAPGAPPIFDDFFGSFVTPRPVAGATDIGATEQ